jgi:hypothetical protein
MAMTLKEMMEEQDMMSVDGYDDCIVGYIERFGQPPHHLLRQVEDHPASCR